MSKKFYITQEYNGYISRFDETATDPSFLVPGSQNVIVDYNATTASRNGYVTLGDTGDIANGGVIGGFSWKTSKGVFHNLRVWGTTLQRRKKTVSGTTVTYEWEPIASSLDVKNGFVTFTTVWDDELKKDVCILGYGNQMINVWKGAYATIGAQDTDDHTITVAEGKSLIDLGFPIPESGTETMNIPDKGYFTYTGATTSDDTTVVVDEATFNISTDFVTVNAHNLGTNSPIKFTTTGTLPTGITADTMYFPVDIDGDNFKVSATPGGSAIDLTGTPSGTHTCHLFTGTLDTFAGVTFSGTFAVGDSIMEQFVSHHNSTMDFPPSFTIDHVSTFRNNLYVGSEKDRRAYISDAADKGSVDASYLNFTTSTAVGGARVFTLDDNCRGFVPSKQSMVIFGSGDSVFNINYTISADQTKELYQIERLATASQQGLLSSMAKQRIKNAIVYVTREKTLDTIEFVENITDIQTVPISDTIKNDFDDLDFDGATIEYWQRNIMIAVPESNVIYMYDLQRKFWQPPIILNGATVGVFTVDEDGNLIGHDSTKNESYLMFNGTNDNGNAIESIAKFAYNNFGDRFAKKKFTRYVQDGYISSGGTLSRTLDYDYKGGTKTQTLDFGGGETAYMYYVEDEASLGQAPVGERSLLGSSLTTYSDERRFRFADSVSLQEFYELQVTYEMSTLDGTFRIVSHGADIDPSASEINDITRNV